MRIKPIILIAEDDDDTRTMMRRLLEMKGYRILEAKDGQQVVDITLRERVGLILMDLGLPNLDGLKTTRCLRLNKRTNEIPIVIVSGWDRVIHEEAAREAGCNEYLHKPFDFDRLDSVLNHYLPISEMSPPLTPRAKAVTTGL